MSPERWRRVEDVYHAALEKSSEERAGFLSVTCGDDTELRQQIEALIRRTESSRSPLDRPPWEMLESRELSAHHLVGPYRILEPVGAGGMGRVYKAVDTRLGRTVALKILKSQFSNRFRREVQANSALNHPNICTLYDVGPDYLVMEFVEGRPLEGPMPVEQALRVAAAVADALDSAHRKGIVHRDLKPANILLAKPGPKLLDFGLATQASLPDESLTREGAIAGTLAYMAPEQLQGREADARSDIFSFGVVFYELLTGRKAFAASDSASTIAAILTAQPAPLRDSLAEASPALERVLNRCLAKDPDERWQSARDLKAELDWVAAGPTAPSVAASPAPKRRTAFWAIGAAIAILAVAAGVAWLRVDPPEPAPVVRFTINPPPNDPILRTFPYISPDGQKVLFATRAGADSKPAIWIHRIFTGESAPLDIEGLPVAWSADSASIAAATPEALTRVDLITGARSEITREPFSSFDWGPDGSYLLTTKKSGMFWGANGRRTPLKTDGSDNSGPFLPGGKSYLTWRLRGNTVETWMARLDGTEPKRLVSQFARYAPPGYLLYVRGNALVAHRFDAGRGVVSGEPQTVVSPVAHGEGNDPRAGYFSVSRNGVLVFLRDTPQPAMQLISYERTGRVAATIGGAGDYSNPALSPDGRRLAVCIRNGDRRDIWVIDLERGGRSRLTLAATDNSNPTWSPDGSTIAYGASRRGHREPYARSSAGTGEERRLFETDLDTNPLTWSPDGKLVLYNRSSDRLVRELGILRMDGVVTSPFLASPFRMDWAEFSPDGRWVLYRSFENGNGSIFLQPYPPDGRKWPISSGASYEAHWRGDSREIYYPSDGMMMALELQVSGTNVSFAKPRELFRMPGIREFGRNFITVSPDGQRFVIAGMERQAPAPLVVVVNWPRLLAGANP